VRLITPVSANAGTDGADGVLREFALAVEPRLQAYLPD